MTTVYVASRSRHGHMWQQYRADAGIEWAS